MQDSGSSPLGSSVDSSEITAGAVGMTALETGKVNWVDTGLISFANTSDAELASYSIAAGTLNNGDMIIIRVEGVYPSSDAYLAYIQGRISDGTNTHTTADIYLNANMDMYQAFITWCEGTTNAKIYEGWRTIRMQETPATASETTGVVHEQTGITNWITQALTVSIRGRVTNAGLTAYARYYIGIVNVK